MGKREEQRKRKEEKQQAAKQRQQTMALLQKVVLYGVAPVILLFVVYTIISQGPTYSPVEIAPNDHLRGDPDAPVSIVVYADFQCPACATEHQTMSQIWPRISDQAHLIFRHFPISTTHPHAWTASLYAEAAAQQGRFWEMHDTLFATQGIWSGMPAVEEEFNSYALELNMDLDQLLADVESDAVIDKVRADQRGGNSAGVRGTPAVFVNGRFLGSPSRQRILDAVAEEVGTGAAD